VLILINVLQNETKRQVQNLHI